MIDKTAYEKALLRLQEELVKMQQWVHDEGKRVVVVVEGRDAAGKGGVILRITEHLNPRWCRIAALPAPSDREKTEWYFQRYIPHLPAGGEMVLFDRSWYNRAGVERVMGFCTSEQYQRFLRQCPAFERMLIDDGIVLVKYWFSVSDEEQEKRFKERLGDPLKRWKLSDMDIESRNRWVEYSKAKDEMFAHCDLPDSPWYQVEADDKRAARLNCIAHLLSVVPYEPRKLPEVKLPARPPIGSYKRPPRARYHTVPNYAAKIAEPKPASNSRSAATRHHRSAAVSRPRGAKRT
ncbi:MAG TPA: polyphosphate kinase 2 [Acidimicrobiales bacterium]|nr:polyphosphate kinase 2 [Acidimicrobiales bacterium]